MLGAAEVGLAGGGPAIMGAPGAGLLVLEGANGLPGDTVGPATGGVGLEAVVGSFVGI